MILCLLKNAHTYIHAYIHIYESYVTQVSVFLPKAIDYLTKPSMPSMEKLSVSFWSGFP